MECRSADRYRYAGTLLEAEDGKLIFQERSTKPGVFHPGEVSIFGGGVEAVEEPVDAAVRELEEELGLDIRKESLEFLGVYEKTKEIHGAEGTCHIFIARGIDPKKLELREGDGIVFLSCEDDPGRYRFTVLCRQLIDDYRRLHERCGAVARDGFNL